MVISQIMGSCGILLESGDRQKRVQDFFGVDKDKEKRAYSIEMVLESVWKSVSTVRRS